MDFHIAESLKGKHSFPGRLLLSCHSFFSSLNVMLFWPSSLIYCSKRNISLFVHNSQRNLSITKSKRVAQRAKWTLLAVTRTTLAFWCSFLTFFVDSLLLWWPQQLSAMSGDTATRQCSTRRLIDSWKLSEEVRPEKTLLLWSSQSLSPPLSPFESQSYAPSNLEIMIITLCWQMEVKDSFAFLSFRLMWRM